MAMPEQVAVELYVDAYYYYYSTIAQSLAGLIALVGAIALFKLQAIHQGLRSLGDYWLHEIGTWPRQMRPPMEGVVESMEVEEFTSAMPDEIERQIAANVTIDQGGERATKVKQLRRLIKQRDSIRAALKLDIWITAAAIATSTVAILKAGLILGPGLTYPGWLFFLVTALFLAAIALKVYLVRLMLK